MLWRWLVVLTLAAAVTGCPSTRPKEETAAKSKKKHKAKKKKGKGKGKAKRKDVAVVEPDVDETEPDQPIEVLKGHAVWYGKDWHGKATASGEKFDRREMTAAHRSLPMGTICRVTNTRNGKSVTVRINDRGPYGKDRRRIIDLSEAAARELDFLDAGWTEVVIEVLSKPEKKRKKEKK